MNRSSQDRTAFTLRELNSAIRFAVGQAFPEALWVIAEIAEAKCNQRGHCYLELAEKDDDKVIAQIKATIWAYDYRKLCHKFESQTGEALRQGMKVMLFASVTFHEVYGLSLNVKDIDPAYTMGDMALRKKEIIERLIKEGLMDVNRALPLPVAPQRIAVISSPTAAGYGDFFNHLDRNLYGYRFIHVLFPALMQGAEAEQSLLSALDRIAHVAHLFDAAVIIRGGGSSIDLSCFDSYALASRISRFPLPVLTGIGHEKDDTVADMVAHTKMKTPTAVAEFLISGLRAFEERIADIMGRISTLAEGMVRDEHLTLETISRRLARIPILIAAEQNRLAMHVRDMKSATRHLIRRTADGLDHIDRALRILDPTNVLKRGYSITRHKGKVIRDAARLKKGDVIDTHLYKGAVTSIVGQRKEIKGDEQEQTAFLFPGPDGA
jgi:exodeoxyribonuclease VII large subunit